MNKEEEMYRFCDRNSDIIYFVVLVIAMFGGAFWVTSIPDNECYGQSPNPIPELKMNKTVSWGKFWDLESTPTGRKVSGEMIIPYQTFVRQLEEGTTEYGFPRLIWKDNGNGNQSATRDTKGDANIFVVSTRKGFDKDYDGKYVVRLTANRDTVKPYYALLYSELDDDEPQPIFRLCPKPRSKSGEWVWNEFTLVKPRKDERLIIVVGEVTKEKITDPNYEWVPTIQVKMEEKKDE